MQPNKEYLRQQQEELEDDLEELVQRLADIQESDQLQFEEKTRVEELKRLKKQLEENLEAVNKQLEPAIKNSDETSFLLLTDRMIDETIEAYFRYHIWTHPDMVDALNSIDNNGVEALNEFNDETRKWIVIFRAKKYREERKQREREWMDHKLWVCMDDPTNPFSFINCLEHRDNIDPEKLRNLLDSLSELPLAELIRRHDLFHSASQRQEKERIMSQRGTVEVGDESDEIGTL